MNTWQPPRKGQMSRFRKSVTHLLAAAGAAAVLWLIPGAAASSGVTRLLSVSIAGSGGVVTTADGRINCGTTCSAAYRRGKVLRLTASASTSFLFIRWDGDCIGTAPICDVALDRATTVSAYFVGQATPLGVSVGGPGRVVSTPAGISCGGGGDMCANLFEHGSTVTLTPVPAADGRFSSWDGPCAAAGSGACTLRVESPGAETAAAFGHASPSPGEQTLTVAHYGPTVHVTSQPAGIDCPSTCSASFLSGMLVTLAMSTGQWGGACAGGFLGAPRGGYSTAGSSSMLRPRSSSPMFHLRRFPLLRRLAPGSTSRCRAKGSSPLPTTRSSAGAHRALAPGARPIRRPGGCTSCGPARGGSRASPNGAALAEGQRPRAASGSRAVTGRVALTALFRVKR